MTIHGINKLTLLDFPEHIACTVFTGGCNMRCPFCQNAPLVLSANSQPIISEEELFLFLKKRRGILEGVCITGGEPTLAADFPEFLTKLHALGYLIKLDTNGTNPDILKKIVNDRLVDYVAMDIKSSPEDYPAAAGIPNLNISGIQQSADFLMHCGISYEFRTTVVKQLHDHTAFLAIAKWLEGADAYYLQAFKDSGDLVTNFSDAPMQLSSYSKRELLDFVELLKPYFKKTGLRGIQ